VIQSSYFGNSWPHAKTLLGDQKSKMGRRKKDTRNIAIKISATQLTKQ
jgi:hypothetical protein